MQSNARPHETHRPVSRLLQQVDPGFYKANQLKLAECYERLRKVPRLIPRFVGTGKLRLTHIRRTPFSAAQTDEAKAWVAKALQLPVANADDAQAQKDATQLAKKLGVPTA